MQAPEVPQELDDRFKVAAREALIFWRDGCTEEQKQTGLRQAEEFKNNPDFAAQQMEILSKTFAECDADGDGRLNREEWGVFRARQIAKAEADGHFAGQREDADETFW